MHSRLAFVTGRDAQVGRPAGWRVNVQIVVDEDRAVYAAWGLGVGSVWSVLNPNTQIQGWKETGWLGKTVAGAIQRSTTWERSGSGSGAGLAALSGGPRPSSGIHTLPRHNSTGGTGVIDAVGEGPATIMGNKWQESGAFAIDGNGRVAWGRKAIRADDLLDLDEGVRALMA